MSMWRCPHCGTPQAETSRCWVCHRSSTTCSTCRNFRRSVAAQVGFCGLDHRRLPLAGVEHRGCWESGPAQQRDAHVTRVSGSTTSRDPDPVREFVPVELRREWIEVAVTAAEGSPLTARSSNRPDVAPEVVVSDHWSNRVTLFAELDR